MEETTYCEEQLVAIKEYEELKAEMNKIMVLVEANPEEDYRDIFMSVNNDLAQAELRLPFSYEV